MYIYGYLSSLYSFGLFYQKQRIGKGYFFLSGTELETMHYLIIEMYVVIVELVMIYRCIIKNQDTHEVMIVWQISWFYVKIVMKKNIDMSLMTIKKVQRVPWMKKWL